MPKQEMTAELFYDSDWQPAPVYTRDGLTIARGLAEESQEDTPGRAGLTFDNRDGSMNPGNPVSPLYGLVGRNTPLRISVDGDARLVGEVADWQPRRSIEPVDTFTGRGDAWTVIEGAGILRRLGRGNKPLKSALHRAISTSGPVAYWPLDDGKNSDSAASGIPGGPRLSITETPLFAEIPGPVGDGPYVNLVNAEQYVGILTATLPVMGTTEWAVEGIFYGTMTDPDEAGTSTIEIAQWFTTGTLGNEQWRVQLNIDAGDIPVFEIRIDSTSGSVQINSSAETLATGWHHFLLTVAQDGSDVDLELYIDGELLDSTTETGVTCGRPTLFKLGGGLSGVEGFIPNFTQNATLAHVAFHDTASPTNHADAAFGYLGETAGNRFSRVCGEEGIAAVVVGTAADSEPMGPQPVATLLELLRECARTDAGLLYETRDAIGLSYRTGRDLYNQDPVLALDYTNCAPPLDPVIGDHGTRNDVLAKRRNGSEARAVLTAGRMSTQDPPDGVGRYDTQLDVNCETDARLPELAGWHLAKGTIDETRWRSVTVDLDAHPELVDDVNAVDIGDRITITGLPADDSPDDASLIVLAVTESIGSHRRLVTFTTVPASVYEIGIVGEDNGSSDLRGAAVDTDNSTLNAGVTAFATSLSVASTGGVLWTTDADNWDTGLNGGGLFIRVGGEDMRVTNITGGSSPQTFTVVRSVNGVVKSHDSGTAVHVRYPVRVGK